jgi:hypothetical protein
MLQLERRIKRETVNGDKSWLPESERAEVYSCRISYPCQRHGQVEPRIIRSKANVAGKAEGRLPVKDVQQEYFESWCIALGERG